MITGGTSGIGFHCAAYLIQQGYQVILTGRNQDKIQDTINKLGSSAAGYLVDSGNLDQLDRLISILQAKAQKIDGLFLNAGIFKPAEFEQTTESLFDETMNINFKGPFFAIQRFIPLLNNPSSVVLNTSIVVDKAFRNTAAYTASKAALESICKVLNLELAPKGIRTNVISPGVTKTPILEKAGMSSKAVEDLMKNLEQSLPIGRPVLPTDIGPILAFLLSEASQVLRGEKIVVDGGSTL